jgi:GH15 family glucan-1,4-alpha-glucosidase
VIEDYAVIGDTQTAALVHRGGSIDWLCLPRFDSPACFARLLGTGDHGYWQLAPCEVLRTSRRYRPGTLVLETEHTTASGTVRVIDCMPVRGEAPDVVRVVEGLAGVVRMRMELAIRFDYGSAVPWVRTIDGNLHAVAGPDALELRSSVATHGDGLVTVADFDISAGDRATFVLTWHPSHLGPPAGADPDQSVEETSRWWRAWSQRCTTGGAHRDVVQRSLITLKALTHAPTGGIVAAATTSLPEEIGGSRNWDYRYCWLRDATFTLYALLLGGYGAEAAAWRDWLLRAAAGAPAQLQIMYGPAGERRLPEIELDWLPGYESSAPVRVGNAASRQFQLDVYGEVMDLLHQARRAGIEPDPESWQLQRTIMDFLEGHWRDVDEGIWEIRGPRRDFTHSKVMAWVAADRAVKAVDTHGLDGPIDAWRRLRDEIRADVEAHGFDVGRNTFTQSYGRPELDASLLMLPLVGFCDANDPRMIGTVAAIERDLLEDGLVRRYGEGSLGHIDGLPGSEGAFLPCSFWLADNYVLQGRIDDGRRLFDHLTGLANDVGLLAEEYDTRLGRLVGNFPQAFTHVALVNTAHNLDRVRGPAHARGREEQ